MLSLPLLSVLCDSEVCRSCLQFVGLGIPADNGGAVSRLCTKSIMRLRFGSGQGSCQKCADHLRWSLTGMSKNRPWSKRSCSGWPKERGKQPARRWALPCSGRGTAPMKKGRERPSWWVTELPVCSHAGQTAISTEYHWCDEFRTWLWGCVERVLVRCQQSSAAGRAVVWCERCSAEHSTTRAAGKEVHSVGHSQYRLWCWKCLLGELHWG